MPTGALAADAGVLQVGGSCAKDSAAMNSSRALQQSSDRHDGTTLNLNHPRLAMLANFHRLAR